MISLMYLLIFLSKGILPWARLKYSSQMEAFKNVEALKTRYHEQVSALKSTCNTCVTAYNCIF